MSGNFNATRPHLYVTGAIIRADYHTDNEVEVYGAHNDAFHETTGHEHTGNTGDGPVITDIPTTTHGLRIPRFTAAQQTTYLAGTPLSGAVWFNTTTKQFMGYNGTAAVIVG